MGGSVPIQATSKGLNVLPLAIIALVLLAVAGGGTTWLVLRRRRR
jgi:hypothetical protein